MTKYKLKIELSEDKIFTTITQISIPFESIYGKEEIQKKIYDKLMELEKQT